MAIRVPKGVLSRTPPDWLRHYMYGVQISAGPVGGQATNCGVYNASTSGAVYYFYSVGLFVSGSTYVNFKQEPAKNYATFASEPGAPIDPRSPKSAAIIEAGTNVGCLGTHVGGIPMLANQNQVYAPGWPFLIIPPGYAGVIECANNNVTLQIAIYWAEVYEA